jgi:DNA-binding HxlR family transcriptional regulator
MSNEYGQPCPMARSLEIVGERWTLLIVRDLLKGPRKFQELEGSVGAPPGQLSRRLKLLEEAGIVSRHMYSEHPPRAEYALTEAGLELRAVTLALAFWGSKHLPGERVFVHESCGHPAEIAYRCAKCDQGIALSDLAFRTEAAGGKRKALKR